MTTAQNKGPPHTPGPWIAEKVGDRWMVSGEGGYLVCQATILPNKEMEEANARLIAAAPEMLEACILISRGGGDSDLLTAQEAARAAIAKANGGEAC